jgi:hypothetical protein
VVLETEAERARAIGMSDASSADERDRLTDGAPLVVDGGTDDLSAKPTASLGRFDGRPDRD